MNVSVGYIILRDGLRVGHPCLTGCNHSLMLSAELADAKGVMLCVFIAGNSEFLWMSKLSSVVVVY